MSPRKAFMVTAHRFIAMLVLTAVATLLRAPSPASAQAIHPRIEVGTRCQQEYQNSWQVDVGNNDVWNRCGNFNNQISKTDDLEFYFNLHG